MATDESSRYNNLPTYVGEDTNGKKMEGFQLRETPPAPGSILFTPGDHDRLDLVANAFYQDPRSFWQICDACEELDPFDVIVPGVPIILPDKK